MHALGGKWIGNIHHPMLPPCGHMEVYKKRCGTLCKKSKRFRRGRELTRILVDVAAKGGRDWRQVLESRKITCPVLDIVRSCRTALLGILFPAITAYFPLFPPTPRTSTARLHRSCVRCPAITSRDEPPTATILALAGQLTFPETHSKREKQLSNEALKDLSMSL